VIPENLMLVFPPKLAQGSIKVELRFKAAHIISLQHRRIRKDNGFHRSDHTICAMREDSPSC